MLKTYIKGREAILRVRRDENGVVSFEYLIVAACIVAAVAAAFGGGTGPLVTALTAGITAISGALTTALGNP